MVCDIINAVTELMVRVLRRGVILRFTVLLGLKPGDTCDVISIATEFMVDAAGVKRVV
jgi:hypothetical protein